MKTNPQETLTDKLIYGTVLVVLYTALPIVHALHVYDTHVKGIDSLSKHQMYYYKNTKDGTVFKKRGLLNAFKPYRSIHRG